MAQGDHSRANDPPPPVRSSPVRRFLPLAVLGTGLAAFFALGLQDILSFAALARHRGTLTAFVAEHHGLAALEFMAVYAAAVALSIPGAVVLTIAGGFLFGTGLATLYVVIGATIGAVGVFLAARTALGAVWRARAGPWMARLEAGFRRDAFSYLLVLRLVPLFPFWLVNLVPAFLGVPLRIYAVATLVGIIPGAFVYASVGNGLGAVLDAGATPDLGIIVTPAVLLPILGLAVLALIPVVWKRLKGAGGP